MGTPKTPTWHALAAAAATLPAFAPTAQADVEWQSEAGGRFSYYQEADLPASATNGLDGQRMQVLSQQFQGLTPLNERWDVAAEATVETLSGASPWFTVPDADGRPIQIMSGATIDEQRYALQGRLREHVEDGRRAVQASISKENDYLSLAAGLEREWDFRQQSDTLAAGLSYAHDSLEPTEGGSARFPDRIRAASKNTLTAYAGYRHAFTRTTVAQLGLAYTHGEGYITDPYKRVYVAGEIQPERRPDHRDAAALTAKLRHYLRGLNAAVHLDLRYYYDSWQVGSDTVEAAWVQTLPGEWRLTPSLRWYEQGYASFYRPYFNAERDDGLYSSDPRLSAYGALSGRVALEKDWGALSFGLAAETYRSSAGLALRHVDQESPGLVDFTVLSLAFSYRWFSAPTAPRRDQPDPLPVRVIEVTP
jgi:hypothetical protein